MTTLSLKFNSASSRGRRHSTLPTNRTSDKSQQDHNLPRRMSQSDLLHSATLKLCVASTRTALLDQEDTDKDGKITVDDNGPKVFRIGSPHLHPDQVHPVVIRGTYELSNLLQELQIAQDAGLEWCTIQMDRITEDPVTRISRRIRGTYWAQLTRRLDASLVELAAKDPKDWTSQPRSRIYVPESESAQYAYYQAIALERPELRLEVGLLPPAPFTAEFVKSLNAKPGVLALSMQPDNTSPDCRTMRGSRFIVPGGRFNELYYWDTYFSCLGLLEDKNTALVKDVVENFVFEINHYGKILNATRSYYLGRSQPPFVTDLARRLYDQTSDESDAKARFKIAILAAIKEYNEYWVSGPRYDAATGLSRYRPVGSGFPPEVEPGHFDHIVGPRAKKANMSNEEFVESYNDGKITDPDLDKYLLHDRAVRESGHDTSYRLENVAADLATIDLNALLYKYETDIAWAICNVFDDNLQTDDSTFYTSASWSQKAKDRKEAIDKYLWNEKEGIYFDYNTVTESQTSFESVTCFFALWCGVASAYQAKRLVSKSLPRFEQLGGLSCGTEASRGEISENRTQRQWDFPFGWAPHQMLTWQGLLDYGYEEDARRLIYRWLHMLTTVAANFNGALVEKYDVTQLASSHKVSAEYGNQGLDFRGVAKEGFGWTNGSYLCGLAQLNPDMKRALAIGISFDEYRKAELPL